MRLLPYAFFLLNGLIMPLNPVIYPQLAAWFSLDLSTVSYLTLIIVGFSSVAMVIWAWLLDRTGLRLPVLLSFAGQVVGIVIMVIFKTFPACAVGMVFVGFGLGTAVASGNWYTVHTYSPAARAGKLSLLNLFYSLGALSSPILVGLAVKAGATWPLLWGVGLGLTLIVLAWSARTLLPKGAGVPLSSAKQTLESVGNTLVKHTLPKGYRRFVAIVATALFFYVFTEYVFTSWIVVWGQVHLGMGVEVSALSLSIFWAFMAVGRGVAQRFIATWGARRCLAVWMGSSSLVAVAAIAAPFPALILLVSAFLGFGYAGAYPTLQAWISMPLPHVPRNIMLVILVIGPVGGVVATLVTSAVLGNAGLLLTFALCPVAAVLSFICICLASRTRVGRRTT